MTDNKRTQGKVLTAKFNQTKRRLSHLFVCGIVLTSIAVPVATVFAQEINSDSASTVTEDNSTIGNNTSTEVNDISEEIEIKNEAPIESVESSSNKELTTVSNTVTEQQTDSTTENKQIETINTRIANPGDYDWKLTSDGYWYAEGWGEGNKYLDTTVNFVDENGTIIETFSESKVSIFHGVVVFLNSPNHSISTSDPNIDFGYQDTKGRWFAASYGQSNMTTDGKGHFLSTVQVDTLDGHTDPVDPEPNKDGLVTVRHIDSETGNELRNADSLKGTIEETYTITPYTDIKGYSYDEKATLDNLSGSFTEEDQVITVIYTQDAVPTPEAKETLAKTITNAKPFVDKTKYQASYVDVLDQAIKDGEEALQETNNGLMRMAYSENLVEDESYDYHTNAINKALEDVKAHPLKIDPNTDNNSDNGDGNTNSGGTNDSKDESNNSTGNTNNSNKDKKTNNNGSNNLNSTIKPTSTKDLPQTGETTNDSLTLAGLGTMLSATLAWFFIRKRG